MNKVIGMGVDDESPKTWEEVEAAVVAYVRKNLDLKFEWLGPDHSQARVTVDSSVIDVSRATCMRAIGEAFPGARAIKWTPEGVVRVLDVPVYDGVWKDPKTGLEWEVEPSGPMNFNDAEMYAKALGDGWRIPTKDELVGISGPKRPKELRGKGWYWSSTTVPGIAVNRWFVAFTQGIVDFDHMDCGGTYVRCVRGKA